MCVRVPNLNIFNVNVRSPLTTFFFICLISQGDAPLRGWMFLCEAVQDLSPEFPAPAFKCRDVCGAELLVVFFPDRGVVLAPLRFFV